MTFPILLEPHRGQVAAWLVGEEGTRMVRPTRDEALAAMTAELQHRGRRGEFVSLEISRGGRGGQIRRRSCARRDLLGNLSRPRPR